MLEEDAKKGIEEKFSFYNYAELKDLNSLGSISGTIDHIEALFNQIQENPRHGSKH